MRIRAPCESIDVLRSADAIAALVKSLGRFARAGPDQSVQAERRAGCALRDIADGASAQRMQERRGSELGAVLELIEVVGALVAPTRTDSGPAPFGRDGVQGIALNALSRLMDVRNLPVHQRSSRSAVRFQHVLARVSGYMAKHVDELAVDDRVIPDAIVVALNAGRWFDDHRQAAPDEVIELALAMMRHPVFGQHADGQFRSSSARALWHGSHWRFCWRDPMQPQLGMHDRLVDDDRGGVGSMRSVAEAATIMLREAVDESRSKDLMKLHRGYHEDTAGCLALALASSKAGSRAMIDTGMVEAYMRAARYAWPAHSELDRGSTRSCSTASK